MLHALEQSQIAALFNVAPRTVREWGEKGLPRNADGTYNGRECVAWYVAYVSGDDLDLNRERARLAKAQADKTEQENEVRRGELIPTEAVLQQWTDVLAAVRAKLLAMPSKLGPQLTNVSDAAIVAAAIKSVVYEALGELVAWQPAGGDADGVAGPAPAAGANGRRVGRPRAKAQ